MSVIASKYAEVRAARRAVGAGILTAVLGLLTLDVFAAEWQPPQSIRDAARNHVLATLGSQDGVTVEAVGVDDRLKLPLCSVDPQARLEKPLRGGQGVVAVSCASGGKWRLFVPVRVVEQVAVVVTTRSVQPGERLLAADLAPARRPSTTLPYEYLTALDQAVGLTVKRTLPAGTVLVPAALDRPALVERGGLVTLVSGTGSVAVRSEGVALEPARLGDRIRVRSQSGRIVEGVVEASGEIRVGT